MIDVKKEFIKFCQLKNIKVDIFDSVKSHDDTTLFCPAGMQAFKEKFKDKNYIGTCASIQSCLRINDLNEITDATHSLTFDMLGLFSFREMSMKEAVDFWLEFIIDILKLEINKITIHPDKENWEKELYWEKDRIGFHLQDKLDDINCTIVYDNDCVWTDGELKGYCTEFYVNNIEIGNIVNLEGDCIDVGFGLDRLDDIVNSAEKNKIRNLKNAIIKLIDSGFKPSNTKQGYILRKLMRELVKLKGFVEHQYFIDEINRQRYLLDKYENLKLKHNDKSKEWWWDTHGIDLDLIK